MNDWLDQRLQDGAARAVGDVTLDDPSSVSTEDAPGTGVTGWPASSVSVTSL